ncbi:Transglycosylase SLT domain-containing protein [Palleronia marisminoris]|uniref:Membrane-bound lytic transglycosylase F n=1 Tax=Palleronia marisminoris TaxID=315423 RepID=A0A1Y5RIB1_9RHOB|nr:lytic transglycosylase domain-containing protein [Palleronia marisminoris]SFG19167.1 Transglycosylase SLT domain-containing protein [Palleronia marisminoris]SLN17100.1 membrane-bound lytic transglycosylase F [Palleronia marisminoris]
MRRLICLLVCLASVAQAAERPRARPDDQRCREDGTACIQLASYTTDVCHEIARAADRARIDQGFFARLLWQESLFDAAAVSPAGAQGIAQFMPTTAALRGLADPFNPAEAIYASAGYLADLSSELGNPGLAAAAYNAGEARTRDFIDRDRILPAETRAYVQIITGHSPRAWRDNPPEKVDYALAPDTPFEEACRAQAASRTFKTFSPPPLQWGVVVAAGRLRATVEKFVDRVRRENQGIIGDRRIEIVQDTMPGFGTRAILTAKIAVDDADEARSLCRDLQRNESFCRVSSPD